MGQIKVATVQVKIEALRKKVLLYADTVESHSSSEKSLIFQFWHADETREAIKGRKIIDGFGPERYFRITGISERLFEMAEQGRVLPSNDVH